MITLKSNCSGLAAVSIDAGEDETLLESGRGKDARLVSLVGDAQAQNWKVWVFWSLFVSLLFVSFFLPILICLSFLSLIRPLFCLFDIKYYFSSFFGSAVLPSGYVFGWVIASHYISSSFFVFFCLFLSLCFFAPFFLHLLFRLVVLCIFVAYLSFFFYFLCLTMSTSCRWKRRRVVRRPRPWWHTARTPPQQPTAATALQ